MLHGGRCVAPRLPQYAGGAGGRWVAVWRGDVGDAGLGTGWSGRIRRPHGLGRPHGARGGARRRCGGLGGSPRHTHRHATLTARLSLVTQVRKQEKGHGGSQELGDLPLSSSSTARCGASVADAMRGRRRVVPRMRPGTARAPAAGSEGDGRWGCRGRRWAGMGLRWAGPSPPYPWPALGCRRRGAAGVRRTGTVPHEGEGSCCIT